MLKNLRKLRDENGVSQKALADAIGVSQQSINKYENHNIEPDIETLTRMADFFGTSIDYIVGHTEIKRKIEVLYPNELNEKETDIINKYRRLNDKQKESIDLIIDNYNEKL